jgi:hypothetical protein
MIVLYIANNMRFASWVIKATNTHSEYVIVIAFLWQQRLRESASILRYTYIIYLIFFTEKCCFVAFDFKKCSFLISSDFIPTSHRGSLRILYTVISLGLFKIWAALLYSLTSYTKQTVNVFEGKSSEARGTVSQYVAGFTNPEKSC